MKITCNRRDEILKQKAEWEAERDAAQAKHDEEKQRFYQAEYEVTSVVKDELEHQLSRFRALQFDVSVQRGNYGKKGLYVRVECNEHNKFDDDVAHRNETLLEDTRNGNHRRIAQNTPRKDFDFAFGFDLLELNQNERDGKNTTYALTKERRPRNARDAHFESRDEQNIHTDICKRRASKEYKRRAAVPHCRENTRCDVVEEHKRQAPNVDVEIEFGIRHNLARRADKFQKSLAERKAENNKNRAQNAARNPSGKHGGFHIVELSCTEKL